MTSEHISFDLNDPLQVVEAIFGSEQKLPSQRKSPPLKTAPQARLERFEAQDKAEETDAIIKELERSDKYINWWHESLGQ